MNGRSWGPVGGVTGRARRVRGMAVLMLGLLTGGGAQAQQVVPATEGIVTVPRGQSSLLVQPVPVARLSIGAPEIADAIVISPREVLINGRTLGTTTLIIWDQTGVRRTYTIEVTVDAPALQRTLQAIFPGQNIRVTATGNLVILTGTVTEARIGRQALELARATGATVVDNLMAPAPQQVMLQVRIAEVSRNVLREFSTQLRLLNPDLLEGTGDLQIETVSDGLVRLLLLDPRASVEAIFRALRSTGEVRTLAEPNLVAADGATASFLAGGEFPFPSVQQAGAPGQASAITIQWREFGVRLNFVPVITAAGNIRLQVAPEVSSLDFATGLSVGGIAVPALLTRRAETEVELRDGQTFAIAGLLDNNTLETVSRIPLLGDLPIIGALFRSRSRRQNRTELLVLVTPRLVAPLDVPPPLPTGEPETWRWDRHLRRPVGVPGALPPSPRPPQAQPGT
jgi:pilus assembly protein CpaC